ncbi:MAG TPA: hypothetical protein VGM41_08320 [Chitinophagaceae bacterium]|jgi:hypothetical protein
MSRNNVPLQPSAARKAELESLMDKLSKEVQDNTSVTRKLKLVTRYKKLLEEYDLYYND